MISVLILDGDMEFAEALAQRLAASGREFQVQAALPGSFAGEDGGEAAGAKDGYDFVLADEILPAFCQGRFGKASLLFFSDAGTGMDALDRYGRVSGLAARLRHDYASRNGGAFYAGIGESATKCIGCFGLAGGCGTSSVAIGVGRDLAAYKDMRTLYLSFEATEAECMCIRKAETERSISDFLYLMLKERDADMRTFLEAHLHKDNYGLERFYPSPGTNDLIRMDDEEIFRFIHMLRESGRFDRIIMDFGSSLNGTVKHCMNFCDAMAAVENGALPDTGKNEKNRALLREYWQKDKNAVQVRNMARRRNAGGLDAEAENPVNNPGTDGAGDEDAVEIAYDTSSFRPYEESVDFVLSNEFGLGIRKIRDKLLLQME
ncbi:MAG: hypothetical protein LBT26_03135 [Clostridiales Family XIII bacterium]|jgi:cellulose biosynthesis protein BcsQ|nr:hypothetical protein [Clostridiales Family XIII bacterium]